MVKRNNGMKNFVVCIFFKASLKPWNVPMRGQFTCSLTLCFTMINKAQHTGVTTSTLLTKECASAAGKIAATHWATTSERKDSRKVDDSFWKQEHRCLSKVCGNMLRVSRLITECENKPNLCDPIYSFMKAYKIYVNNQLAQTTKNPTRLSWWLFIKFLK